MNASAPEARPRELIAVAAALAALVAILLWSTDGGILLTRPFWVDEWFTVLVASHASPVDVIGDLRHGADGGASLLHLVVWALHAIAGSVSPVMLRTMSLVFVWGALCAVYVVLRRRFGRDASLAGVLAVGSQELVIAHAFEGRFYGLWLLCCGLHAWSLCATRQRDAKIALSAVLLVTSHWYGIVSLALMSSAVLLGHGRRWRDGLRLVAPSSAGVLALVVISPLAAGQRAAVTVGSWIPDFQAGQLLGLASRFWATPVVAMAAGALVIGASLRLRRDGGPALAASARSALADPGVVALLSLAFMPLALALISVVGLPSMLARYAIPAALSWGPFVAFAVGLLGRWPARAFAVALVGFWLAGVKSEARRKRAFAIGVRQQASVLRQAEGMGLPIVYQSQHTLYPVAAELRRGAPISFLDLPDSTLDVLFPRGTEFYERSKGVRLERDFARVQAARVGFPVLTSQATLDAVPRFLLIATPVTLVGGASDVTALAAAAFPRHHVQPVTENLLLLERRDGRSLPARNTSR